jgi:methionyl-tRNA formyltransferase
MPEIARIVFFGTPEFAVPTLDALVRAGKAPVAVVTQPARPAGRGRKLADPPVAQRARGLALPVLQPDKVSRPDFVAEVAALAPDLAVVVAFGQIFPRPLLAVPRLGCLNLHASLLPRHRGAAPIQAAIAAGEDTTGVTTMRMDAGLDTGPILLQEQTAIGPQETAGELAARLAELGGRLVVETVYALEDERVTPRPQPEGATYAPRLTREAGRVDWTENAATIANRLRAYTPWPGLTGLLRGAPVKLCAARPLARSSDRAAPGTVLAVENDGLLVACGASTVLAVIALQRPGRKPLAAADFVRGERLAPDERFS